MSSPDVPLIKSSPAVPESLAARAVPERATTSIATIIVVLFMPCPFRPGPGHPGCLVTSTMREPRGDPATKGNPRDKFV